MSRAVDAIGTVKSHEELGPGLFRLVVEAPGIARSARPGQFVQMKVSPGMDPLLRRPMSIAGVHGGRIEILYEVVGTGTRALSQRRVGETLPVLGPLGRGFAFVKRVSFSILVGGGSGVPPLLFLAERMKRKGLAFLGARTKSLLLGEKELRKSGWEVEVSTDDGTRGHRGFVSDIFAKRLSDFPSRGGVYACGPIPMIQTVAGLCAQKKMACQVSLEAMMACGIGICRGCVVPVRAGGKYMDICREGPVVEANRIDWEALSRAL